jgi:hypothetical protein
MCDQVIAEIARELIQAMKVRAKTRHPNDLRTVLLLQTQLAQAVDAEKEVAESLPC